LIGDQHAPASEELNRVKLGANGICLAFI